MITTIIIVTSWETNTRRKSFAVAAHITPHDGLLSTCGRGLTSFDWFQSIRFRSFRILAISVSLSVYTVLCSSFFSNSLSSLDTSWYTTIVYAIVVTLCPPLGIDRRAFVSLQFGIYPSSVALLTAVNIFGELLLPPIRSALFTFPKRPTDFARKQRACVSPLVSLSKWLSVYAFAVCPYMCL